MIRTSYTTERTAALPSEITATFGVTTTLSVALITVTVDGLADSAGSAHCHYPELDCVEKFTPAVGLRQDPSNSLSWVNVNDASNPAIVTITPTASACGQYFNLQL